MFWNVMEHGSLWNWQLTFHKEDNTDRTGNYYPDLTLNRAWLLLLKMNDLQCTYISTEVSLDLLSIVDSLLSII